MKPRALKSALAAITAGLGLALATGPASALVFFQPITGFQDDNLDYVVDNNSNGVIDVGDRLISVSKFTDTQGVFAGQGPASILPGELTAIADITVAAIVAGQFVFAPSGAAGVLSGFAPGTAIAAWLDTSPDTNVINSACGTRAACLLSAGLGGDPGSSLFLTAGFFGDPDELWVSSPIGGGAVIATVEAGGASTKFGSFNFALSVGFNGTGQIILDQSCVPFCGLGGNGLVQLTGSGDILGGQFLDHTQWTARSDSDAQIAIPEPSSLALLGAILAAAGLGSRRRKFAR